MVSYNLALFIAIFIVLMKCLYTFTVSHINHEVTTLPHKGWLCVHNIKTTNATIFKCLETSCQFMLNVMEKIKQGIQNITLLFHLFVICSHLCILFMQCSDKHISAHLNNLYYCSKETACLDLFS